MDEVQQVRGVQLGVAQQRIGQVHPGHRVRGNAVDRVSLTLLAARTAAGILPVRSQDQADLASAAPRKDAFEDLSVGQTVRFHEEEGDEGPQASTVIVQG